MKLDAFDRLVLGIMAGLVVTIGAVWVLGGGAPHSRGLRILYLVPEGSRLHSLRALSLDGGEDEAQTLFTTSYQIDSYSAGPDGAQIVLAVENDTSATNLWIVSADGGSQRLLLDCAPDACTNVAWSPAGDLIAYERHDQGDPGAGRIWLYDVATGETTSLFEDPEVLGQSPTWSRDGAQLAFYDVTGYIGVVELASGAVTQIPSLVGTTGAFSPDGLSMVYPELQQVGRLYVSELWVASLDDAASLRPLLENAQDDQSPAWSPDGAWIAFARRRLEDAPSAWVTGRKVMLCNPETGQMRQLTYDLSFNNTAFAWDPTGERLLIQRLRLEQDTEAYPIPELWVYTLADGSLQQVAENASWGSWLP
jgi:Tol biopolymer transport system component